ncbi:MAG: Ubiquitinol-cytochrome reductase Fe-S subunit signal [Alphaproteobacteria bacterium]|nr:Ubiquitinol-cytochrome reductase Fe-S subunit signal [Alphaproteobacteria bacterium]
MDHAQPQNRRSFLTYTAYAMGAIAVGTSGLVMINSMNPAADVWGRGITNIDLKNIKAGARISFV